MRSFAPTFLAALLSVPALAAHADPVAEARSATAACLSAVINGAPVDDIDGDDVTIRRGKDPVSCTVTVSAGLPVQVRDAVLTAVQRRPEAFGAAKSAWAAGDFASRETWCNLPSRRAVAVFISTAKPGLQPVLVATVFETPKRDDRCDRDLGVQTVATGAPPPPPAAGTVEAAAPARAAAAAPEPTLLDVPPPRAKKKSLLRRIPGFGKKA